MIKNIVTFFLLSFSMTVFSAEYSSSPKTGPVIVFDFGGVVGETDLTLVAKEIAPILDLSYEEAFELVGKIRPAEENGVSLESFWANYQKTSKKPVPEDWIDRFIDIKRLSIRARPEMLSLVDALRNQGYRVAIFSNVTSARAAFIRQMGIYSHFESVILSCEIGVKKPDRAAFDILLDKLGVPCEEVLFIDNNSENIEMARQLGMDCIKFTSITELYEELSRRKIGSVENSF